ncbi:MAG: right-handed parallel beta-helix repeat-containing protein, partial [Planctomycetota bacterium]
MQIPYACTNILLDFRVTKMDLSASKKGDATVSLTFASNGRIRFCFVLLAFLTFGTDDRLRAQEAPPESPPPQSLSITDHPIGQAPDAFKGNGPAVGAPLFRFSFSPSSTPPVDIVRLGLSISDAVNLVATDLTNVQIVEDSNGNGTAESTETTRFPCTVTMSGKNGTISAIGPSSSPIHLLVTQHYVLVADVISLSPEDSIRIGLSSENVIAYSAGVPIETAGEASYAIHSENVPLGTYFVSASRGTDTNLGTLEAPWATLLKATASVPAGATVFIEPGTYAGGISIDTPGTETARIAFIGDERTGEVVVDATNKSYAFHISPKSGNVSIVGMRLKGPAYKGIHVERAPSVEISRVRMDGFDAKGIILESSTNSKIVHSTISGTCGIGLYIQDSPQTTISDVLVKGSADEGVKVTGTSSGVFRNLTSHANKHGVYFSGTATPRELSDSIVTSNTQKGIWLSSGTVTLKNNDVFGNAVNYQGVSAGSASFSLDPNYVDPSAGNFHLSQIASGQSLNSPCLDMGSGPAETLGVSTRSTRTDGAPDSDVANLGYHYEIPGSANFVPPTISISAPAQNFRTRLQEIAISGTVSDDRTPASNILVSASVAGGPMLPIPVDASGNFQGNVSCVGGIES